MGVGQNRGSALKTLWCLRDVGKEFGQLCIRVVMMPTNRCSQSTLLNSLRNVSALHSRLIYSRLSV